MEMKNKAEEISKLFGLELDNKNSNIYIFRYPECVTSILYYNEIYKKLYWAENLLYRDNELIATNYRSEFYEMGDLPANVYQALYNIQKQYKEFKISVKKNELKKDFK